MTVSSRRVIQGLNEKAHSAVRGVGRLLPSEAKRFVFRLRPAAVTWNLPGPSVVFVQIPKVATTSMRAALAAHVFGDAEIDPNLIDERDAWVGSRYELNAFPAEIRKMSRERFCFAFVRNPLDRLYSAYVNKVVAPRDDEGNLFRRHRISLGMSFPEFVDSVMRIPEDRCDLHLRSQHHFIRDRRGYVVQFIGRFEHLEEDWQVLRDRFGFPPLPRRNASSHAPWMDAYTPALARRVSERYRRDVELFGYEEQIVALT